MLYHEAGMLVGMHQVVSLQQIHECNAHSFIDVWHPVKPADILLGTKSPAARQLLEGYAQRMSRSCLCGP